MEQQVILVNEKDEQVGTMDKTLAHQQGVLHRALSIFIFNDKGEMLMQQRALGKYHSGGLWSNACCSHPSPGESVEDAAHRRLKEELGFDTELHKVFDLIYRSKVGHGLVEHEFDHVFIGTYSGPMELNPEEIMDAEFGPIDVIGERLKEDPGRFTSWFRILFPRVITLPGPSA